MSHHRRIYSKFGRSPHLPRWMCPFGYALRRYTLSEMEWAKGLGGQYLVRRTGRAAGWKRHRGRVRSADESCYPCVSRGARLFWPPTSVSRKSRPWK